MLCDTIERYEVRCLHCGVKFYTLRYTKECPHCKTKYPDIEHLGNVEIEISINPLTGEVTAA